METIIQKCFCINLLITFFGEVSLKALGKSIFGALKVPPIKRSYLGLGPEVFSGFLFPETLQKLSFEKI